MITITNEVVAGASRYAELGKLVFDCAAILISVGMFYANSKRDSKTIQKHTRELERHDREIGVLYGEAGIVRHP